MQIFFDTYQKYIVPEDILILAVSGGVDSMVLLWLIVEIHPKDKIIVAHFDHRLRWDESDGDRELVASICKSENIAFEYQKMDISSLAKEEKMSIEAIARRERYAFLESVRIKYGARYILTAHHMDDRIETAIFNLIRGSKLWGIHALSESIGSLLRPLLGVTKEEIHQYAEEHDIRYRDDSSNSDSVYLRNYLRHEILPLFSRINPEYRTSLQDFIAYTEELKSWIDREVQDWLDAEKNSEDGISFSAVNFQKKSPFFQKEIVRYIYETVNQGTIGLSEWLVEEILRFILTANGGTEKSIGKSVLKKMGNRVECLRISV